MPSEPRELLCMKCGREHPVWSADNDLWNAVVRRPDGSDEWPFLCPTCFMRLAEERGVETNFRVLRAAHQERDADARRLAALHRLVAWWDDTSWGSTRWIAELAAIVENCRAAIDAAMAADTQTPNTENDHADD